MAETFDKNMIDKDEYPRTAELEHRCVNMLSRLWNSPDGEQATGTSTTGSSEAAMLAGMALKWRWRERQREAKRPTDHPNMVMGANVQVCWEKFCRYWDVEARLVPMEGDRDHLTADPAVAHCDENSIGVVAVLGSTFDGSYEPIAGICSPLDRASSPTRGWTCPSTSTGRRARSSRRSSTRSSSGLPAPPRAVDQCLGAQVRARLPGRRVGVIWRDPDALPDDLVFRVNYLGGDLPTFALNFSRPGNQVAAQYYNFLRLGFDGYRRVQQAARDVARYTADAVAKVGPFRLITDGSELPVFAFALDGNGRHYSVFDVSEQLREGGLAGARVHVPRESAGPRGIADRRPQRRLPRPRRLAGRGPSPPRRVPRAAPGAAPQLGGPRGFPSLNHPRWPRVGLGRGGLLRDLAALAEHVEQDERRDRRDRSDQEPDEDPAHGDGGAGTVVDGQVER
jgi:glutamate decarboxylase